MFTPDGDVKILSCIYWYDCKSYSSHKTDKGFTIDFKTKKGIKPVHWYSAAFANEKNDI